MISFIYVGSTVFSCKLLHLERSDMNQFILDLIILLALQYYSISQICHIHVHVYEF